MFLYESSTLGSFKTLGPKYKILSIYCSEDNTWEPDDNLECDDLVKKFEDSLAKGKKTPPAPKRESRESARKRPRTSTRHTESPSITDNEDEQPLVKKSVSSTLRFSPFPYFLHKFSFLLLTYKGLLARRRFLRNRRLVWHNKLRSYTSLCLYESLGQKG